MNRRSQAVGVLVATAVAVVSTLVVAPSANAWEPPGGGVFNYPQGGHAAAWRIVDTVDAAIKHAPKGSRIMVSSFLMDANRSADALIAARRRGVAVQLVLDGNDGRTGQTRRIARVVNRDNKPRQKGVNKDGVPLKWGRDESFVVFCKGTCRGGGDGNNHTKFYLFTKTGSARNVVMVSSSNLNAGGAVRGWNDMYVMKDRLALLRQYASIHAQMAQDRSFGTKNYRQVQAGNITARFFPRPHGGDPVLSDLRQVRCHGATGGAGRGGRTAINISMFAWNSTRGMAIARRLVQLQSHGCYVSIVYGAPSAQVRVHAGSQNWGRGTLRHGDENTINIVSRKAYTQYIRNWDSVVKVSRRIGGPREAEIAATQPALRSLIR